MSSSFTPTLRNVSSTHLALITQGADLSSADTLACTSKELRASINRIESVRLEALDLSEELGISKQDFMRWDHEQAEMLFPSLQKIFNHDGDLREIRFVCIYGYFFPDMLKHFTLDLSSIAMKDLSKCIKEVHQNPICKNQIYCYDYKPLAFLPTSLSPSTHATVAAAQNPTSNANANAAAQAASVGSGKDVNPKKQNVTYFSYFCHWRGPRLQGNPGYFYQSTSAKK